MGNPILLDISFASLLFFAIPFSACLNPPLINSSLNLFLSSAKSIESYCVPRIGIFFSERALASFIGI